MSGRRALALRREMKRRGLDPLGKDRNAYRRLKKEVKR
jgi:hypothetical protein